MTRLFFIAITLLLASVAVAQQAPAPKPPDQTPQQPAQAGDMAITVLVDEPAGAIVPQAGPLVINATFDAAVPPIASAVRNANVVTITTTSPSRFNPGDTVTISGVTDSSFNGTFTVTGAAPCNTTTNFTYAQTGPNATSGGGSISISVFAAPRMNIPVVTGSGLHTAPAWMPNDLMVPCSVQGVRLPISLYPASSLVARGYAYVIPMQFVDATSTGTQDGSAVNPWQSVTTACASSPSGMPLLLANETFHVNVPFRFCANASAHVVNAARGGAVVSP